MRRRPSYLCVSGLKWALTTLSFALGQCEGGEAFNLQHQLLQFNQKAGTTAWTCFTMPQKLVHSVLHLLVVTESHIMDPWKTLWHNPSRQLNPMKLQNKGWNPLRERTERGAAKVSSMYKTTLTKVGQTRTSVPNKKGLPSIREQEWMLQKFDPEAKVCIDFLDRNQVVRERETLGELVARFSVQYAPHLVSQKETDYWNKIRQRWESKNGALPNLNEEGCSINEEGRSINEEGGSITNDDEWQVQVNGRQLSDRDRTTHKIFQKDLRRRMNTYLPTRTEQAYLRRVKR
ncbi:hypothetical protein FA10DRAFT_262981 [Acaromyces ingoldii]|uniref:Uncharacterized protein n=1 Tax=Acaromyces ingoldii TaxID=215250 RepID=A0A316YCQ1_9BASI|nr:hypothetical protein FA10DRAFT_262981 [Acaromyces ingoldii]PWN87247.1 hypothetical protein FA10DRAFT_262981 [Acaromyces ingoldii]